MVSGADKLMRDKLTKYSIKHSFHIKEFLENVNINGHCLVSCDVASLFTNVPVNEARNELHRHASVILME